jgi:hypothetical protein
MHLARPAHPRAARYRGRRINPRRKAGTTSARSSPASARSGVLPLCGRTVSPSLKGQAVSQYEQRPARRSGTVPRKTGITPVRSGPASACSRHGTLVPPATAGNHRAGLLPIFGRNYTQQSFSARDDADEAGASPAGQRTARPCASLRHEKIQDAKVESPLRAAAPRLSGPVIC